MFDNAVNQVSQGRQPVIHELSHGSALRVNFLPRMPNQTLF